MVKRETADWLLSTALADNQVSNREFQLIMNGFTQYNVLKILWVFYSFWKKKNSFQ